MNTVQIRPAESSDIPPLAGLEASVFSYPRTGPQLLRELTDGFHFTLLATDAISGQIIGYCSLTHILDEGYISNIATAPEFRRQGIADTMLGTVEEYSRNLSLSFISLEVRASNISAISLYQKHSFIPAGVLKSHYTDPVEDAIIMTLNL